LDQFEEFVILEDRASAEARRLFLARLQQLCQSHPPGLCVLLSFRRDYMGDVIAMKVDDLIPGQTFMEIDAFRRGPARRFLEASPIVPKSGLVDRLLAGAEAIDDVPARFRPITLNMLGLALQDYDREVAGRPERLVQRYVESAVSPPEIKEIAPRIVEKMITDENTKRPRTVTELVTETALREQDVVACLVLLERGGLVRRLDDLWEISHDFVARQFALLLDRLRPNPWRKIGIYAVSGLFVLFLGGLVIGTPIFVRQQAFAALASLQIPVTGDGKGKWVATMGGEVTEATVTRAVQQLALIEVNILHVTSSQLTSLPSLDKLTALTTLDLSNSLVTSLPSLDKLTALTTLNLSGSQVTGLPSLDKLAALKTLNLVRSKMKRLPSLDGLTALETLNLSKSQVETLPSLDKLAALKTLNLFGSQVKSLPSLDGLTALTTLTLSSLVTTLPSLDRLTALKELSLPQGLLDDAAIRQLMSRGVQLDFQ
jgi:hypothetical protein